MTKLKNIAFNLFFRSQKGREALSQVSCLSKFGHFGEAASVARKTLDDNPVTSKKLPEITSYERKLLSGSYLSNKKKAMELGQKIPVITSKL